MFLWEAVNGGLNMLLIYMNIIYININDIMYNLVFVFHCPYKAAPW